MILLRTALIAGVAVYLSIVLVMYFGQRRLQYHPEDKGLTPEAVGLSGIQVARLETPDGERIVTWYTPARGNNPTILYFHGNAGEIGDRPKRFAFYATHGYGVLYVSYRGFGGSSGSISEAGLITDALTSYDWLIAQGLAPERIALVGESLGSGVAVQLAAQRNIGAVALEAPYTSTADVAAAIYWWLPVRLLMKDQFQSLSHIGAVRAPLLIIHGEADRLIPADHGKRLFAAANQPKQLVLVPGAGHEAIFEQSTWAKELAFFERAIN